MHAHRLRVRIAEDRELRIQLPSDFAPGEAEVIVLESGREEGEPRARKHTLDELLGARLAPPVGVGPVTLADIERAIAEGAVGRGQSQADGPWQV